MDFIFKPWKLAGLIGGIAGIYLCSAVGLFVLIVFITIQQLPFGHVDAWRWFIGEPMPVGVTTKGVPSTTGLGLDPAVLVEWFGGHVTAEFHDLEYASSFGRVHNGIDFSLVVGSPIRSTWEGTIIYAGWSDAGYGNLTIVENGDWQMYYAHLSAVNVSVGQEVQTGTVVGLSGNTGWSTGPHLHYEVRHGGVAVDPVTAPMEE
jgi:murein DD-endopeptidase MepM/ murein hydrolase activator NlpD